MDAVIIIVKKKKHDSYIYFDDQITSDCNNNVQNSVVIYDFRGVWRERLIGTAGTLIVKVNERNIFPAQWKVVFLKTNLKNKNKINKMVSSTQCNINM